MKLQDLFGACAYKPITLCKNPSASLKITFQFPEEALRLWQTALQMHACKSIPNYDILFKMRTVQAIFVLCLTTKESVLRKGEIFLGQCVIP